MSGLKIEGSYSGKYEWKSVASRSVIISGAVPGSCIFHICIILRILLSVGKIQLYAPTHFPTLVAVQEDHFNDQYLDSEAQNGRVTLQ
eukprot:13107758-Ditylum_brightwellii.AAC.1